MQRKHVHLVVVIVAALLSGSAIAEAEHKEHAHNFSQDVDALHAVLAPLWHATAGKERSKKVCARANKLETLTRNIQNGDTTLLLESITALKSQCKTNPTKIDDAFSKVHEAFHGLAEH